MEPIKLTPAQRAAKRAEVSRKLPIPEGTRLAAGDLEFLYRFVTQYPQRFAGRSLVFSRPTRHFPWLDEKPDTTECHSLHFAAHGIELRETRQTLRGDTVVDVQLDRCSRDAAAVLQCLKDCAVQGMLQEFNDLTELLVFGPEYRW